MTNRALNLIGTLPARAARVAVATVLAAAGVLRAQSLEELAADPSRWPTEVTITASARGTVIKDGAAAGAVLLGVGRTLKVTGLGPDGITGRLGTDTVRVAVDKTDLWQRVAGGAPAAASSAAAATAAPVPGNAPAPTAAAGRPSRMQRNFAGKLVRLEGGALKPVDAASLTGVKYYALYFSASWCGPCRQFTPHFVREYRRLKAQYPEFEAVFVSADRSAGDMRDYMKGDDMPWLAVKYDQRTQDLLSYSGPGIPCLVLVGADGVVLSDSYEGENYVGPGKVLADTAKILRRLR